MMSSHRPRSHARSTQRKLDADLAQLIGDGLAAFGKHSGSDFVYREAAVLLHHHHPDRPTITAADPVPDDLREALTKINNASWSAH